MTRKIFTLTALLIAAAAAQAQDVHRWVVTDDGAASKRAFIGAALAGMTPELREYFGAPSDNGVLVVSLTENGPAAKAGLRVGDVIVGVDSTRIGETGDIPQAIRGKHSGDTVRLDVIRNHKNQSVAVAVEERDMREFRRTYTLDDMQGQLQQLDGTQWRALVASPDTEELRTRIRDLETRLHDLEKKMQQQK